MSEPKIVHYLKAEIPQPNGDMKEGVVVMSKELVDGILETLKLPMLSIKSCKPTQLEIDTMYRQRMMQEGSIARGIEPVYGKTYTRRKPIKHNATS